MSLSILWWILILFLLVCVSASTYRIYFLCFYCISGFCWTFAEQETFQFPLLHVPSVTSITVLQFSFRFEACTVNTLHINWAERCVQLLCHWSEIRLSRSSAFEFEHLSVKSSGKSKLCSLHKCICSSGVCTGWIACHSLKKWVGMYSLPGCFWRGFGRLVTHVCGHIRMLQGWRLPSRKNCLVSEMWIPPSGVLGKVFAGTRARQ